MKEFFGFGGFQREPEGYMSFEHLSFVTTLMILMIGLSVYLGIRNRGRDFSAKNRVLIITAILIDTLEIIKIVMCCIATSDPWGWKLELPLFLCSIQLITVPLAAFARGRVREAASDFVMIFGVLGAVLGTYGAAQNYAAYPVFSYINVISGLTHSISGFAAIYIGVVGLASLKRKNVWITFSILGCFCIMASVANAILDYNYMFLRSGDGTPYDIFYNLVGGNQILYPLTVIALFLLYISVFYAVWFFIEKKREIKRTHSENIN